MHIATLNAIDSELWTILLYNDRLNIVNFFTRRTIIPEMSLNLIKKNVRLAVFPMIIPILTDFVPETLNKLSILSSELVEQISI